VKSEVLTTGIDENTPPFRAGYVSSASVMIPRRVFETVGELDNVLFYWGDADYGLRIQQAGLEVWCVPEARMVHLEHRGGTSSGLRRRLWSISRFHLDAWRYYRKNSGHGPLHPATLGVGLGLLGRWLSLMVLALAKGVLGRGGDH
jgi:GT2 family glycosyltransferase